MQRNRIRFLPVKDSDDSCKYFFTDGIALFLVVIVGQTGLFFIPVDFVGVHFISCRKSADLKTSVKYQNYFIRSNRLMRMGNYNYSRIVQATHGKN